MTYLGKLKTPDAYADNLFVAAAELTRDELAARLVRAGEIGVSGGDQAEVDTYFATEEFRFHGPDGFDWRLTP